MARAPIFWKTWQIWSLLPERGAFITDRAVCPSRAALVHPRGCLHFATGRPDGRASSSVLETVLSIFSFDNLDPEVRSEIVPIKAQDGGESRGVVYQKGAPDTVVMVHPPAHRQHAPLRHPGLVEAGFAAFGHNTRWLNNDIGDDPRKAGARRGRRGPHLPRTRLSQGRAVGQLRRWRAVHLLSGAGVSAGPARSRRHRRVIRRI